MSLTCCGALLNFLARNSFCTSTPFSVVLQWSHVKAERRRPWRHLLLLTHSSTWSALTRCPWNNTTVCPHRHIPELILQCAQTRWRCPTNASLSWCSSPRDVIFRRWCSQRCSLPLNLFMSPTPAPQPRLSCHHWVTSSPLLLPRWPCQQRGLWEPLIRHSGPHCTQISPQRSYRPKKEVSHLESADMKQIMAWVIVLHVSLMNCFYFSTT